MNDFLIGVLVNSPSEQEILSEVQTNNLNDSATLYLNRQRRYRLTRNKSEHIQSMETNKFVLEVLKIKQNNYTNVNTVVYLSNL